MKLFEPIRIGSLELPNRIVMPAMHLNYTMDGKVSDQLVNFYVARAKGGVGLAIVGGMPTCQAGGPFTMPQLKSDDYLPGLRRLTGAVHDVGGLLGAQLYDAGAYSHRMGTGVEARSATAHVSNFTREPCHEMSAQELQDAIDSFASAALRAKQAGFDMVEVIGSAGYLICQFLSPVINKRTDQYGGGLENRMRFGLEVLAAGRESVGPDYPVGIRLAGNDFVPGSHTNKESALFASQVERFVDLINVTGGWHECSVPQLSSDLPRGAFHYLARGIKEAVSIPVAASNRINNSALAERFLLNGFADLICMGRPLIADPDLPNKARAGHFDDIRPCTACNQVCFDRVMKMKPVGCMVNPRAGFEGKRELEPAASPRRVMVVGAGVAGLEAALAAKLRGHHVELFEKADVLGGQVVWAAEPTDKPEFPTLLRYYANQLRMHEIAVHLNHEVSREQVERSDFDVVVVATGASPLNIPIPGADRPEVVQAWDVLRDKVGVGERVVIVGGGSVGCEMAVWLAQVGCLSPEELYFHTLWDSESPEVIEALLYKGSKQVTVVEMMPKLAKDLGSRRWIVSAKMKKWGVQSHTHTKVLAITDDGVVCEGKDGQPFTLEADSVVLSLGSKADNRLSQALAGIANKTVVSIGDCARVAKIPEAIEAGYLVAREL